MIFGRRKKSREAERQADPAAVGEVRSREAAGDETGAADAEAAGGSSPTSSAERAGEQTAEATRDVAAGPFDVEEVESTKGYLDFGALLIPAGKDQKVRLDIDQKTRRVVALTIAAGQASIQVQPFSAPKSGGTWDEVREQIQDSVVKQKGKVKQVDGRFGREVAARVPTTLKDGRPGWRVARFIGFEGPRWFLRGVVGGRGAIDPKAAREVEDLFSRIVVVRGDDPMPPRELLPLRPPEGAKRVPVPRNPAQRRSAGPGPNPAAAAVGQGGGAQAGEAPADDGRSSDGSGASGGSDDGAGR